MEDPTKLLKQKKIKKEELLTLLVDKPVYNEKSSNCWNKNANTKTKLYNIAKRNIDNHIGKVNYNKYGTKGCVLEPVTKIFCDNFIIETELLVPTTKKEKTVEDKSKGILDTLEEPKGKIITGEEDKDTKRKGNPLCGAGNSKIRGVLTELGIKYTNVKAIGFTDDNIVVCKEEGNYKKIRQRYKVAVPDLTDIEQLLKYLNSDQFLKNNLTILDVDFTLDFAGTFNKEDTIDHLLTQEGFASIGTHAHLDEGDKIILDNDKFVGNNCLTYMKEINGIITRNKIYNKFAQSLESAAVRESVGTHLADWVNNPEYRLTETIPKTLDKGFTRLEITFYKKIPTFSTIQDAISDLKSNIIVKNTYATPIHLQWKAFTEKLTSNLVVYHSKQKAVLVGYWYNQFTKKIGGFYRERVDVQALYYILCDLTLHKPINLLIVSEDGNKTASIRPLTLKTSQDKETKLIRRNYIYSSNVKEKTIEPEEAGILPYNNIIFRLVKKKQNYRTLPHNELFLLNKVKEPLLIKSILLLKRAKKKAKKHGYSLSSPIIYEDNPYKKITLGLIEALDEYFTKEENLVTEEEQHTELELLITYKNPLSITGVIVPGSIVDLLIFCQGKTRCTAAINDDLRNTIIIVINKQLANILDNFKQHLDSYTFNKSKTTRTIFYHREESNLEPLCKLEFGKKYLYDNNRHKFLPCNIYLGKHLAPLVKDVKLINIDILEEDEKEQEPIIEEEDIYLRKFRYIKPFTRTIKLLSCSVGTTVKIVEYTTKIFRKKDYYLFKDTEDKVYRSNNNLYEKFTEYMEKYNSKESNPPCFTLTFGDDCYYNSRNKERECTIKEC